MNNDSRFLICGFTLIVGYSLLHMFIGSLIHINEKNISGEGIIINKFLKDESDGYVTILIVAVEYNKKLYKARVLESSVKYNSYYLGQKINLIFKLSDKYNGRIEVLLKPSKNIQVIYCFCIFIGVLLMLIFVKNFYILLKENRKWFSLE